MAISAKDEDDCMCSYAQYKTQGGPGFQSASHVSSMDVLSLCVPTLASTIVAMLARVEVQT